MLHYIALHLIYNYNCNSNCNYHCIALHCTTLHYTNYTTRHYNYNYTTLHYTTLHYTNCTTPQLQLQLRNTSDTTLQLQLHYTTLHYNYNYNYTKPHYIQQLWWGGHCSHCSHSIKHNSNHLSVHQWLRSCLKVKKHQLPQVRRPGFQFGGGLHQRKRGIANKTVTGKNLLGRKKNLRQAPAILDSQQLTSPIVSYL